MENFIEGSKYRNETISVVVSFADVLSPGDSILGLPTITISVASGSDPTPSLLLYQGVSVINGDTVEQRFRLGISGVIYVLLYTVQTVGGDVLQKECYLAILPEDGAAIPTFAPVYETTTLYPLILSESFQANAPVIGTGKLFGVLQAEDQIITYIQINAGVLTYQQYYYTYPLDSIIAGITIGNGVLTYQNYIPYSDGPESIKTGIAILNGTMVAATLITYNIPYDAIQTGISIQNGTLT